MKSRNILGLAALLSFSALLPSTSGAETRELLLAAYSVPKEAYEKRIIPAFVQHWKQKTGETIQIKSSFAASGAQARAVVGGLDADIAALSMESDLQQLVKAGLVTSDWKRGAQKGIVTMTSPTPRSKVVTDSRPLLSMTLTFRCTRLTRSTACWTTAESARPFCFPWSRPAP